RGCKGVPARKGQLPPAEKPPPPESSRGWWKGQFAGPSRPGFPASAPSPLRVAKPCGSPRVGKGIACFPCQRRGAGQPCSHWPLPARGLREQLAIDFRGKGPIYVRRSLRWRLHPGGALRLAIACGGAPAFGQVARRGSCPAGVAELVDALDLGSS